MGLKWWQTADIVTREANVTRSKTNSLLDRLARQTEARKQRLAEEERQKNIRSGELARSYALAEQRYSAWDEIRDANRKLLDLGYSVDGLIPINQSSIKQQIMSGRSWTGQVVQQAEAATAEARSKAIRDEAEDWAKWETRQVDVNWADYSPEQKEQLINDWYDKVESGNLPAETKTNIEIPQEGVDLGDGFKILPDYSVVDATNQTVGTLDPTTGEIKPQGVSAGQKIRNFFSAVWKSIPLNPYYWMSPEQQQLSDYKHQLVSWASSHNITNPEQWVEDLMDKPTKDLTIGPITEEELEETLPLPTLPPDYLYTAPQLGLGTSLSKGEQFIGEWIMPVLTLALMPSAGAVRSALQPIIKGGGVAGRVAQAGRVALKPIELYEQGVTALMRLPSRALSTGTQKILSAYLDKNAKRIVGIAQNVPTKGGKPDLSHLTTKNRLLYKIYTLHNEYLVRQASAYLDAKKAALRATRVPEENAVRLLNEGIEATTKTVDNIVGAVQSGKELTTASITGLVAKNTPQEFVSGINNIVKAGVIGVKEALVTPKPNAKTQILQLKIQLGRKQESLERLKLFEPNETAEIKAQEEMVKYLQDQIGELEGGAVKPTAPTVEVTALAEGETVTGEVLEGEVSMTGLESKEYDALKQLRTLRTRYANQKIKYEDVKKQLIDYVKENLPKEAQGKMLASVKNVRTEAGLQKALNLADKYAEQAAQKNLKSQITKELRTITPKKQVTGYRYGRFTAETQRQLTEIKKNTAMDREAAKSQILQNMEAAENGKMSFEEADKANEILAYSGLKGMSSGELADTLQQIKSLKETGRGLRAAEKEAEAERIEKLRTDVINTVTGGKGIKPGVGTIDTHDLWAREGKVKSFVTNWQYGMDDIFDKVSRFDKSSKPFQSPVSQIGFSMHTARSINQAGIQNWIDGKTADRVKEIYGIKGRGELHKFLGRLATDKIDIGTFVNTEGKQLKLSLTKDQIIQKYLELQDPTLDETFRVGMKWTDEMMSAVRDSMTADDIEYANWLSKQYVNDYGKTIKPAFEEKYHIPLPENPHYVPLNRELEGSYYEHILTAQDNYRYAGVSNNSLKARTKNRIPLKFNGATQVWVRHVIQMEHFKAFWKPMKEARMVFRNPDVRTAIKQYHGNDILKHIDRHLDDIARDGIDRALIVQSIDKLRGHFTLAALGVKVNVAFKQALSVPAYLTYEPMPIKDFFTGVADFWKHPKSSINEMRELSGYFTERWGRGHERDVRLVKEKDVAGRLSNAKNWRDLLMLGIHKVDTAVTQPGAWSVYKSMLRQGMSKQEAITHAEVATKRSQPSFGLEDMAALRKHGSWGKLFTMFQSQPNKYYRLIADSARNLRAGRGSRGRNLLNILLAWWVLPAMFQLVSDAFQWKSEHQARVAILGPANYLLAAGQILQSAYGWITGEPFPAEASPVFSTLREMQYALTGTVNLIEQGKDPLKDVDTEYLVRTIEHYAKGVGQIVGVPTPYAVQIERMIRNADLRQLVFSEYALKNEGDAVGALQDAYAQAYGYKKWADMPDNLKEHFYELRPDLK